MNGPGRDDQLRARAGSLAQASAFLKALRIFACAESLGGVESLAEHPAIMTHASLPAEARRERSASATGCSASRSGSRTRATSSPISKGASPLQAALS